MKKKIYALLVMSMLSSMMTTNAWSVELRGVVSCGKWVTDRQSTNKLSAVDNEGWLVGFLSGMAYVMDKNVLHGTDNNSIFLWTDNYCRANPLNNLADSSEALYIELIKKKQLK